MNIAADIKAKPFCWAVRIWLALGLLIGLIFDLSQLEGKGWEVRAIFFSLVMLILPAAWRLSKYRFTYSYLADAFLVMPFALDIWGNIAGLYDSINNFDNILHLLNWVFLVGCFTLSIILSSTLSKLNVIMLGTGFGAIAIIAWEAVEYVIMKLGTERLFLTYEDTISDLLLSTSGGLIGALLIAFVIKGRADR